ncbi:MAG: DUF5685 family protein [Oscillospiraceae bacterium]|nr:DUF5685 family protein [Oscillospiraceae bacterium]
MFGYIRPLRGELKVKDYEIFKSVFCGMCHSLRERCGLLARFTVNYDLAFMAMLLSDANQPCFKTSRCIASPFRKKKYHSCDNSFATAAVFGVILTYQRLKDTVKDEVFFKSIPARGAMVLLKPAYKKAFSAVPLFGEHVQSCLSSLFELEKENCSSVDKAADKFADILKSAAVYTTDDERRRTLEQIFYHIGRVIYILDAYDDLKDDIKKDRYNPLAFRFAAAEGILKEEEKEELRIILKHSENLIISAFELLETGVWSEILANTIYYGLPSVIDTVFSGNRERHKKRCKPNGDLR